MRMSVGITGSAGVSAIDPVFTDWTNLEKPPGWTESGGTGTFSSTGVYNNEATTDDLTYTRAHTRDHTSHTMIMGVNFVAVTDHYLEMKIGSTFIVLTQDTYGPHIESWNLTHATGADIDTTGMATGLHFFATTVSAGGSVLNYWLKPAGTTTVSAAGSVTALASTTTTTERVQISAYAGGPGVVGDVRLAYTQFDYNTVSTQAEIESFARSLGWPG